MKSLRVNCLGLLILVAFAALGCSSAESSTESAGSTEVITEGETRGAQVISLNPSATEILFEIGAGEQVVAVDAFSDFPSEAPADDRLDAFNPDLEVLVSYEPTLVILGVDSPEVAEALEGRDVEVLLLPTANSVEEMLTQIVTLGEATGQFEEAVELSEDIELAIADTRVLLEGFVGMRLYHEVAEGNSGFFYNHEGTFLGDIYSQVGFEVVGDADALVDNEISAEILIAESPELILLNGNDFSASPADVANRTGWESMPAVASDQIFVVDSDTSSRSGPRIIDYLDQLVVDLSSTE